MGHTEKLMEGKQIIKARLFAKVFQEIQDFRTDSHVTVLSDQFYQY